MLEDLKMIVEELGIDYSEFQIYNSSGEIIESYDTEKKDTLGDIFAVLNNYGFTSSITDGVVSISSNTYFTQSSLFLYSTLESRIPSLHITKIS